MRNIKNIFLVYIEIPMNYRPYGLLNYYFRFILYGGYFHDSVNVYIILKIYFSYTLKFP
ncbi:hypothetical protein BMW23_0189 [Bodo saltans virus]|uniref:Uncharacterized protein n=2 Tax=Bodo saltans virus TaxID=2024608 RepID=A0A2H4UTR7_9VIRU|nr:hypothetical protein QJ851_gp0184 [Bodo saltans virus]ATZ80247.1 hypothetical protein BMW23_0189 [Bodo saltans virus]